MGESNLTSNHFNKGYFMHTVFFFTTVLSLCLVTPYLHSDSILKQ